MTADASIYERANKLSKALFKVGVTDGFAPDCNCNIYAESVICLAKANSSWSGGIVMEIIGTGYEKKPEKGQYTMLGPPKKPRLASCIVRVY